MNKLVTVLGVAAVATLAGCKDPNYKPMSSQNDVKTVEPVHCTCPVGTVHETPCACGADDCVCGIAVKPTTPEPVVVKPVEPTPAPKPAEPAPIVVKSVEPETTIYIVQPGDYLAKISKKYNVTINSIKRLNDLKTDTVRVGQKLKLPGKIDVGVQKVTTCPKAPAPAKKGYTPYKGETKEYVVKSGDTLGAVAYGNGCTIRQLKDLNGLTSDVLKVGQKLKIPAGAKTAAPAKKPIEVQKINEPQSKVAPTDTIAVDPTVPETQTQDAPQVPESAPTVEPTTAPVETTTYVVQEGDDMTGVSIRFCVSAGAIRELNNLAEDAQLTPGQIIKLPADAQQ